MKDYEWNERALGTILQEKAKTNKNKVFLYYKDQEITYEELNETVNRVANGFLHLGVKKGDKVVIMLPTCPAYLYTWFALSKIGAVEVPINTAYKGDLLQYVINNSDAQFIVADTQFLDRIKFIQDSLQNIKKLIIHSDKNSTNRGVTTKFDSITYSQLFDNPPILPAIEVKPTDLSAIIYTSGTTGPSKGVMMTHHYFYAYAGALIKALRYTSEDVIYACLPFFHVNGQMRCYGALIKDAKVVMAERFSASGFWEDIRKYKATEFSGLGAMAGILYNQPEREDDTDNPVRVSLMVPSPADICEGFENRFNLKLIECYGSTETNMPLIVPYDAPKIGSCGKSWGAFEVNIFDDNDNELPPGVTGEIVVRPNEPFIMMSGYYKMPEATLEAFRNLWFHTGDLGRRDEEGYFYFMERKKDAIRRRGENISAYEVEKVINSHPKVAESAAIAVPSAEFNEDEVKIVVVLKEGENLLPEELIAFCEERMAYFMIPRYVEFEENLPKTPTEKVEKYKLKEEGITIDTWDREKAGYKLKR